MSMALSNTTHYSITDEEFSQFKTLLYDESGITLSEHKKTLLVSRLTKRLRKLELKSFTDRILRLCGAWGEWRGRVCPDAGLALNE